jgi:hypothetical protein
MAKKILGVFLGERNCCAAVSSDIAGIETASIPSAAWVSSRFIAVGDAGLALFHNEIVDTFANDEHDVHKYLYGFESSDPLLDATAIGAGLSKLSERLAQACDQTSVVFAVTPDQSRASQRRLEMAAEFAGFNSVSTLDSFQAIAHGLDSSMWRRTSSVVLMDVMSSNIRVAHLKRVGERLEVQSFKEGSNGYSSIEESLFIAVRNRQKEVEGTSKELAGPEIGQLRRSIADILRAADDATVYHLIVGESPIEVELSLTEAVSPLINQLMSLYQLVAAEHPLEMHALVVAAPGHIVQRVRLALSRKTGLAVESVDAETTAAKGAMRAGQATDPTLWQAWPRLAPSDLGLVAIEPDTGTPTVFPLISLGAKLPCSSESKKVFVSKEAKGLLRLEIVESRGGTWIKTTVQRIRGVHGDDDYPVTVEIRQVHEDRAEIIVQDLRGLIDFRAEIEISISGERRRILESLRRLRSLAIAG